nr:MAG TPA: hypothetical protein [Caudoviricetes sp.]
MLTRAELLSTYDGGRLSSSGVVTSLPMRRARSGRVSSSNSASKQSLHTNLLHLPSVHEYISCHGSMSAPHSPQR